MLKTVYEDSLDSFLYGDTCVEDSYGYVREAKGVTLSSPPKDSLWIPKKVVLGVGISVVMLATETSSWAASLYKASDGRVRFSSASHSSRPTRLDDRTRQELVNKILKVRDYFGLTQEDVAKLLFINKSTLSKLERGEHSPDVSNLAKYSMFLDLADYLKEKLKGRKYAIRQLFYSESKLFGEMNPIEFSNAVGEEGLREVYSTFKRLYG